MFPTTFTDLARQNAIKDKLVGMMSHFNNRAAIDIDFRAKVNAILNRVLKITIDETNSLSYGGKVVDNQLVIETSYMEHPEATAGMIAGDIMWFIDNNQITKIRQSNAVKLAKGYELERQTVFTKVAKQSYTPVTVTKIL